MTDPFELPPGAHRWSGWPGAWCLDCGIEDPLEACVANHEHGVDEDGMPDVSKMCKPGPCPEPGSKRHDPYAAAEARKAGRP